MKPYQFFKSVFSYGVSARSWAEKAIGREMEYSFVSDFAMADWSQGEKGVRDTLKQVRKSWGKNYKAMTEVALSFNLLSWFNNQMKQQDIEGREKYIELYSNLWYEERDHFYETFKDNKEAKRHFYEMTD